MLLSALAPAGEGKIQVASGHPRIFLRAADLPRLQERCRSVPEVKSDYGALRELAYRGSIHPNLWVAPEELLSVLAAYLIEGRDPKLLFRARAYLEAFNLAEGDHWTRPRMLKALAIAYDWLHGDLSEAERRRCAARMLELVKRMRGEYRHSDYNNQVYLQYGPILYAAVALAGDGIDEAFAEAALAESRELLREHFIPAINQAGGDGDGGWHEGLAYFSFFACELAHQLEAWRTASGEDLFPRASGLRGAPAWLLHCTRPHDGSMAPLADIDTPSPWGWQEAAYLPLLAARYQDGIAQRALALAPAADAARRWPRVLWFDPAVEATPLASLPPGALFRSLGWAAMRSGWEKEAVWAIFACGDTYSGHQHSDQNGFVISMLGDLAIDAGEYGAKETSFHNTVLIGEGQRLYPTDPRRFFAPTAAGGEFDTGDIVAYEDNSHFTYAAGDASNAHGAFQDGKRVQEKPVFIRRFIFLKPSTFVIDDRVRAPSPETPVRWLLHSHDAPAVEGRRFRVADGGGELVGETLLPADAAIEVSRRSGGRKPREFHQLEVAPRAASIETRFLHVLHARRRGESSEARCELAGSAGDLRLTVAADGRIFRSLLPSSGAGGGELEIAGAGGEVLLERRPLPSGALHHGAGGAREVERWDAAYRGGRKPPWDTGRPSSELRRTVESGAVRPGRALDLGCGTGTNVLFLAERGFDATGIDIAPTALALGRAKAEKAGLRTRFLLADVLAPPALEPFDFIFDRGCYHGLRGRSAAAYLESVRRLSHPGTRLLIMAGNANEPPPHYGPPRVKEAELRGDLSALFDFEELREARFDTADPNAKGALAWSALLLRADGRRPAALDLREPMALAARAITARLDPAMNFRPWFLLRGQGGIPAKPEHASWDLGDMTGRYLESLIDARRLGIRSPELSEAEGRLGKYLLALLGPDGLVHDPATGKIDHPFSQGSALYGLLAWFEDSGDPAVREAAEKLIAGLLKNAERQDGKLIEPAAKLPESSGSHLAGYQIWPAVRFHELTGSPAALELAEGLSRWVLDDPVLGPGGAISKPLSWEGHIHSWLDALAGCARAARISRSLDRAAVIERCRAAYDWTRRTDATAFGWIATYPTGGSSETCAISSAIRLALELAAAGHAEYLADVERFARNQVIEAQFRDLGAYAGGSAPPSPLLLGCFDSQSMPNGHLGTRGGEDAGTVEGCCLNGGMRALALAWGAILSSDEGGIAVHLGLSRDGPAAEVIGYQPFEGRVDVIPRSPGAVRLRAPDWAKREELAVLLDGAPAAWRFENGYAVVPEARAGSRISLRYPLRELEEEVSAGGEKFRVRWRGDAVIAVDPPGAREPAYRNRPREKGPAPLAPRSISVPDGYEYHDAARLAAGSMLARLDLERGGQPFFRIYPFASPPRAEHEKWDDGDMSGRYVEALIACRRIAGLPMDRRETLLRSYLAGLFDPRDGLAYTRASPWTPRRACLFSQSCAMLGLLAWNVETGSEEARRLLDRHAGGLMKIAIDKGDYAFFPKYEYDGKEWIDDPKGKDAPAWYGGRSILPLVEYWKLSGRAEARAFAEKLARYSMEVNGGVKPDGEVRGDGWWGHLHSTMDMAAGIAELGRLTGRGQWVSWAKRVYDWIGRTHANRCGWVADAVGSPICESCAIASRIRLGLALRRTGAVDPFGEIDRFLRNQLLENQFADLGFLAPLSPETPRTERATYAGIDRMIRGTFQCWGTANDLIGHDDIEGCGAGGGVQALALAWNAQSEWLEGAGGKELRVHLLFNRAIRGPADPPLSTGTPIAAELWSHLPREGRVEVAAHRSIPRLALRLPDGAEASGCRVRRAGGKPISEGERPAAMEGPYAVVDGLEAGERVEVIFPLREYETVEAARGESYRVRWKGSAAISIDPPGKKVPLYANRAGYLKPEAPRSGPRYP